jgi:hypothetical protein
MGCTDIYGISRSRIGTSPEPVLETKNSRQMNPLRLVRQPLPLRAVLLGSRVVRHASTAPSITVINHSSSETALPLSNVEAQWETLSREEKLDMHHQLETLQKKDWKVLSIDEKKAGGLFSSVHDDGALKMSG